MKYIKNIVCIILLFSSVIACDNEDLLKETPKDFLSPENSFTTKAAFESALARIYGSIRTNFYAQTDNWSNYDMLGIDLDVAQGNDQGNIFSRQTFNWNTFNADNGRVRTWWGRFYRYIFDANVIIGRAESDVVKWNSEEEKNAVIGEARFLRAYAYHFLANMWGGVPIILEETTEARFDYTRATQEQVYQQCKEDLEFAVQWMHSIDEIKDGMAPRAAAYHTLAEVNIQLGDYDGAISAASSVIDGGELNLMTERFGKYKDFQFNGYDHQGAFEPWGDVYWDLFRDGNFNRGDGNMETIWNVQFDVALQGGGNVDVSNNGGYFVIERWWNPLPWNLRDKNNVSNYLKDTLAGRGVGGSSTQYMAEQVWNYKGDFDRDIRNSEYNIQRTHYWTNPAGEFYGQPITADNVANVNDFNNSRVGPQFMKTTSAVHFGQFQDATSKEWHDNGRIYKDYYIMRLAETYLLRAEAHMLNGANGLAADDINALRNRANATIVDAGDVDLDLILDERARELHVEEYRLNTLLRTGKLVEYLNKYHSEIVFNGWTIPDYVNKWPIPNSEIERNSGAELLQNPGYE